MQDFVRRNFSYKRQGRRLCINWRERRNSEDWRECVPRNYCTARPRSVHMVATQVPWRGGEGGKGRGRTKDPFTDTIPSVCLCTKCPCTTKCAARNACIYMDAVAESSKDPTHRSVPCCTYVCTCRRGMFLLSVPRFCLTLTPSYFARSRLVVAVADNATARMADLQLMCNPSCWRSLRFLFCAKIQRYRARLSSCKTDLV